MIFSQGDIVKVNLNPIKGHEQGNYRPVLVISSVPMPGNVNLIVPITSKTKTYPLEVMLDSRTATRGCILCFQMRTVDLQARNALFIEHLPDDLLDECLDYCKRILEPIC